MDDIFQHGVHEFIQEFIADNSLAWRDHHQAVSDLTLRRWPGCPGTVTVWRAHEDAGTGYLRLTCLGLNAGRRRTGGRKPATLSSINGRQPTAPTIVMRLVKTLCCGCPSSGNDRPGRDPGNRGHQGIFRGPRKRRAEEHDQGKGPYCSWSRGRRCCRVLRFRTKGAELRTPPVPLYDGNSKARWPMADCPSPFIAASCDKAIDILP